MKNKTTRFLNDKKNLRFDEAKIVRKIELKLKNSSNFLTY